MRFMLHDSNSKRKSFFPWQSYLNETIRKKFTTRKATSALAILLRHFSSLRGIPLILKGGFLRFYFKWHIKTSDENENLKWPIRIENREDFLCPCAWVKFGEESKFQHTESISQVGLFEAYTFSLGKTIFLMGLTYLWRLFHRLTFVTLDTSWWWCNSHRCTCNKSRDWRLESSSGQ